MVEGSYWVTLKLKAATRCGVPKLLAEAMKPYPGDISSQHQGICLRGFIDVWYYQTMSRCAPASIRILNVDLHLHCFIEQII